MDIFSLTHDLCVSQTNNRHLTVELLDCRAKCKSIIRAHLQTTRESGVFEQARDTLQREVKAEKRSTDQIYKERAIALNEVATLERRVDARNETIRNLTDRLANPPIHTPDPVETWLAETTEIIKTELRRQNTAGVLGAELGVIEGFKFNYTPDDVTDDIEEGLGSKSGQSETLPKLTAVKSGSGQSVETNITMEPVSGVSLRVKIIVEPASQPSANEPGGFNWND